MSLFGRVGPLPLPEDFDGRTPTFERAGAAPSSATVRPPGSIIEVGGAYYCQRGTLSTPVWTADLLSRDAYYRMRAARLLDAAPSSLAWVFDDLYKGGAGFYSQSSTGYMQNTPDAKGGGWVAFRTGAVAGQLAAGTVATSSGAAAYLPLFYGSGTGHEWYAGVKLKPTTTATYAAHSRGGLMSRDYVTGNKQIVLGITGAASTANWSVSFQNEAYSLNSGVAMVNGTWVVLESYRKAGTTYLLVNETVVASGTSNLFPGVDGSIWMEMNNPTEGGVQEFVADWFGCGVVVT